ncbi:hypothetical protein [Bradyrhizobium sp.]|uniref:hypothetical protein n=1 Tax=Bradyrhizobium sp. TaxID=376 RepID=UPI0025B92214|nr:hypothetical protein [Bradyrhizobium sp.]
MDDAKTKIESAIESLAFKGLARLAMLIFSALGVPAMVWLVTTVNNTGQSIKLLSQTIQHNMVLVESNDKQIRADLDVLRFELQRAARYSRDDAERDFKIRDYRIEQNERRIDGLEMRR